MKLTQLAAKPQLVKIILDDEAIVKEYGEPIEFWLYDRQPIDSFIRLAQMKDDNTSELINMIKTMVLDENGNPVMSDENILPTNVLTKVVTKVVETLGK